MKKLLLGLAATVSLIACGGTEQDPRQSTLTEETPSPLVVEGDAMTTEPIASYEEPSTDAMNPAATCWVVLEYCKSPSTGGPVCTFKNCTPQRAVRECNNLIQKNC